MLNGPITVVNVNLVPMDKERIVENQTVIVQGERIAQVGHSREVRPPPGALRIEGYGKYLMPGLADMHTHTWGEADLLLFLANGVTTIRNMWGSARQLAWRARISAGSMVGPTIFTAGPLIDGRPPIWNTSKVVVTPEEGEKEVAAEKERGYDFVKVYNRLSLDAYRAILAAAKKLRMPVAGHIPDLVGLETALKAGQDSIEHLTGYLDAIQADDSPVRGKLDRASRRRAIDYVDESKIPRIIALTRDANAWNCVTLVVNQKFVGIEDAKRLLDDPRMKFVPPEWLASWDPTKDFRLKDMTAPDFERIRRASAMRTRLTRDLHLAGARILLGTDTPNPFVIPGFSIHEELQNLVKAGLSPYEAIRAGTKDAAEFLNASSDFGTIELGKRADMILVDGNPLQDVAHVSRPLGVMARGKWYAKSELQRMLEELVATYVVNVERFEKLFDPFPSEGEALLSARYWFKSTDTLLGEERLVLQNVRGGVFNLSSQLLVNAPPRTNILCLSLDLTQDWAPASLTFDSETAEGQIRVSMKPGDGSILITGTSAEGMDIRTQRDVPGDVLLGSQHIASYLPAFHKLQPLNVGEKQDLRMLRVDTDPELAFSDVSLRFERKEDAERKFGDNPARVLRVYEMAETTSNSSNTGLVFLDSRDRLVMFERVEQMGLTRFEIVTQRDRYEAP